MRQSKYFILVNKLVFVTAPSLSTFSRSLITICQDGRRKKKSRNHFHLRIVSHPRRGRERRAHLSRGLKVASFDKTLFASYLGDWAASIILTHTYLQQ